jgi:hypothetical protein
MPAPTNPIYETTKEMFNELKAQGIARYTMLRWFLWFTAAIVVLGIYYYYRYQMKKESIDLKNMNTALATVPITLSPLTGTTGAAQYKLRDYYIASSYNSCCPGDFLDDYVSLDALRNVIKRGVRFLDFEIYSYKGDAVVAASPIQNFHFKGTYNSIPIGEVFQAVNSYALSSACPNPKDPLFLHLRVKSNNIDIYKKITKALTSNFNNLLAQSSAEFADESHGENITNKPIMDFRGKICVICDNPTKNFRGTPLEELINLVSGGNFVRGLREHNVEYASDMNELMEHNKKNMSIVLPDLNSLDTNQNAALQQKYGCQFTCMSYQNLDANLEYYLKFFANSAFVLKPANLRYQPTTIKKPPPQDPSLSYAPRSISMPQFSGSI